MTKVKLNPSYTDRNLHWQYLSAEYWRRYYYLSRIIIKESYGTNLQDTNLTKRVQSKDSWKVYLVTKHPGFRVRTRKTQIK